MSAGTSGDMNDLAGQASRRRPRRTGTVRRRWSVLAELLAVAAGVVGAYYWLIAGARRLEVRAVADLLHLLGFHQISGALGTTLVIFRPNGQMISAALTPSCSSLISVLALGGLAGSVLRHRRVHTLLAFVGAAELLITANIARIGASAVAGLWFGRPALVLFHDWVGTVWNFAGTLAGFLLLVALTLPTAERAEQDRAGRHTARRPAAWGGPGLGYRVPALDRSQPRHRGTLTGLAVRNLLPVRVSRFMARRRETGRIDYRIGHLSLEQRVEAAVELARPGLGVHTASLLAIATYESEPAVLDALAIAVVASQWEPVSSSGIRSLRLWARGWLLHHPEQNGLRTGAKGGDEPPGFELDASAFESSALKQHRSADRIDANGSTPIPRTEASWGSLLDHDLVINMAGRTRRTVAVTGAGGAAGVAVIRHLVAAGHRVIALDADPLAVGLRLASVGTVVPLADAPGFAEAIVQAVATSGVEALIGTVAEEYPALTSVVPALDALGCGSWLPDVAAAEMCNDKMAFALRLREADIAHPPTASNPRSARHLPGPWIVKPRRGRGSRDVVRVDDPSELARVMASIPGAIAQSRLSGREFTADALVDRDGRLLTCVPRWRVETKAGISVRGVTFESDEVTRLVAETLAAVGITGPANVQGFVDADGATAVIEVNPRFSGGLSLTLAAGADVVGAYLVGICEPEVAQPTLSFTPGVQMLRYFAEVFEDTGTGQRLSDPANEVTEPDEDSGTMRAVTPPAAPTPTLEEPAGAPPQETIDQRRVRVLQHAALRRNVTETCRIFGISRTTFYRWKNLAARERLDASVSDEPGASLEPVL